MSGRDPKDEADDWPDDADLPDPFAKSGEAAREIEPDPFSDSLASSSKDPAVPKPGTDEAPRFPPPSGGSPFDDASHDDDPFRGLSDRPGPGNVGLGSRDTEPLGLPRVPKLPARPGALPPKPEPRLPPPPEPKPPPRRSLVRPQESPTIRERPAPNPPSQRGAIESEPRTERQPRSAAAPKSTGTPKSAGTPRPARSGARSPRPIKRAERPFSESMDASDAPPRRPRRWAIWAGITGVLVVLGGLGSAALVVRHYSRDLPSVDQLKRGYEPPQVTRILASDGSLLASIFQERRTVVPFGSIADSVKLAFLAAEDAYFYEHEGLNYVGIARALIANVRAGHTVQGGSTITQQVVKTILLDATRSYGRKIREALLARRLEQHLTKDEIFWLYLNHIYLGHGRYGIEEAARYYFGKSAARLRVDEAATLAGIVASPEHYSPRRDPERAIERRAYVLNQMLEKGFIQPKLHAEVNARPLRIAPSTETESELSPEAVTIAESILKITARERASTGGFTVHTTIDPKLEVLARKAVRDNLDEYARRQHIAPPFTAKQAGLWGKAFVGAPQEHKIYVGVVESSDDRAGTLDVRVGDVVGKVSLSQEGRYNPTHLPPSEFAKPGATLRVSLLEKPEAGRKVPLRLELGPQSALVAIDLRTRNVVALVGSYEALAGGLNRATQAKRQPGSAFKPLVYSWALHARRITPALALNLTQKGHGLSGEPPFRMSVRSALAQSNNEAAEWILKHAGPAESLRWAQALGIESPMQPTASLALGAYELAPFEIARAFAVFAGGGEYVEPTIVSKITAQDDSALSLPLTLPARRVMEADEAYLVTSLLESVVRDGTGHGARQLRRPVAGKTGTTNDAKDAWFVGYSTEYVVAVWVGYDDSRPLGKGESGARTALGAWTAFMQGAHEGKPPTEFVRPPSVVLARVDPATGLLPYDGQETDVVEEFLNGTVPTEAAPVPGAATPATTTASPGEGAGGAPAVPSTPTTPDSAGAGPEEPPPPF